jgi:hypothetical protein
MCTTQKNSAAEQSLTFWDQFLTRSRNSTATAPSAQRRDHRHNWVSDSQGVQVQRKLRGPGSGFEAASVTPKPTVAQWRLVPRGLRRAGCRLTGLCPVSCDLCAARTVRLYRFTGHGLEHLLICSSCTCIHKIRRQQGWRKPKRPNGWPRGTGGGALTQRSTGVRWAACTPRFARHGSRGVREY